MIYVFFKKYYTYLTCSKDYTVNLFAPTLYETHLFDPKMLSLVDKYTLV